jgi:trans-aconitate 2-methyltransferase
MSREMGGVMWDPNQYLTFADARARPFYDLVSRVAAKAPDHVVDLGCGPGNLTASLADRWPDAEIVGVDSSAEMIAAASRQAARPGLSFRLADVRDWRPEGNVDVIVCNALLQWVPGHMDLLPGWVAVLAADGWLAFQLPGNFDQPSHAILRELSQSAKWRHRLSGVELNRQAADPAEYLDVLARMGLEVDAWETSYLHVLHGEDAVTQWYKGTGLRPVLAALEPDDAARFVSDYSERINRAYPPAPYGTVLPFRRVFVVAHKH